MKKEINLIKVPRLIEWIICMVKLRYHYNRLLFSKRIKFLEAVAPRLSERSPTAKLAWPDAFFLIKQDDIKRALKSLEVDNA